MCTHQTLPLGYPNEGAAEVVLAALREWLEQHKDKVRAERTFSKETGAGELSKELVPPVGTCPSRGHSLGGACFLRQL